MISPDRGHTPDTQRLRVGIADDHELIREGIMAVISRERQFVTCGTASTPGEALDLVATHRPAVLLLDLFLGGQDGKYLLRDLSLRFPRTRVLVLSPFDDDNYAECALRLGASGYVVKSTSGARLIEALNAVATGEVYGHRSAVFPLRVSHE